MESLEAAVNEKFVVICIKLSRAQMLSDVFLRLLPCRVVEVYEEHLQYYKMHRARALFGSISIAFQQEIRDRTSRSALIHSAAEFADELTV